MSGDDPTASGEAAEAVPLPPHQVATGAHAIVAPPAPYPTGQVLPGFVAPPAPARSVPWPDLRRDGIAVVGLLLALIFPWNGHFSATDGPAALVAPTFLFIVAAAVGVIASAVVSLGWTTAAPGGSALRVARTAAAAPLALLGVGVVGFDVIVSIIHVGQWIPHNPGVGLGVWGAAAAFVAAAAPRGYDLVSAKDESRRRGTPVALAWVAVAAALFGTVRLLVGAVISLANDDGSVLFGGIRQTAATVVAGPLTVLPAIAATLVIAFGLGRRDPSLRSTALAVALGLVVGGGVVFGTDGTPEVFGFGYYGLGLLVAAAVASLGSPSSAGQDATTPGRVLLRAGRHAAVWIAVVSVAELVAVLGWTLGSTGRVGGTVFAVVLCVAAAVLAGIAAVIWWPADPRALPNRAVVLPLLGISASMTFVRYLVEDEGYWSRPATITLAIVVTALATIVALVSAPSVRAEYAAARPARAAGPDGADPYAPPAHPAPGPVGGPAHGAAP
uniref:DUF7937 domain-containing protein n=1 Tax=Nocardia farcinica TaxID=37329 RepID=UPI002453797F